MCVKFHCIQTYSLISMLFLTFRFPYLRSPSSPTLIQTYLTWTWAWVPSPVHHILVLRLRTWQIQHRFLGFLVDQSEIFWDFEEFWLKKNVRCFLQFRWNFTDNLRGEVKDVKENAHSTPLIPRPPKADGRMSFLFLPLLMMMMMLLLLLLLTMICVSLHSCFCRFRLFVQTHSLRHSNQHETSQTLGRLHHQHIYFEEMWP